MTADEGWPRRLEAELGVSLFIRAGRRLVLTDAGRTLQPHAERTLAAAEEAAESVKEVRSLKGGTVSFGTFGSAHHYLLGGLVQDFRRSQRRHRNSEFGGATFGLVTAAEQGDSLIWTYVVAGVGACTRRAQG